MNKDSVHQFLVGEISTLSGPKNIQNDRAMICCPFHNDKSPSGSISLDVLERRVPIGHFRCFGCKKSVGWSILASALNLRQIEKPENLSSDHFSAPTAFKSHLLEDTDKIDYEAFPDMKELRFIKFSFKEWRGVSVSLLKQVGARLCVHRDYGTHYVWIPAYVNGMLRGYTNAKLQKPTDGKPSYLNAKGQWSRKYGLLYFDYAINLMQEGEWKTIVLCEGQRDALRFLGEGIPAVAVIGAQNWSYEKRDLLEEAGVERVIIAFDGDDAGRSATAKVYSDIKQYFSVKFLALWKHRVPRMKRGEQMKKEIGDGKFKLLWDNEMDPFDCPQKYIEAIRRNLK